MALNGLLRQKLYIFSESGQKYISVTKNSDIPTKLRDLCNPEIQDGIHKSSPITSIPNIINANPRSETYFFNMLFNMTSHLHPSLGLFPVV